jgi:transcriptional regulator with XRE-family HTH domain
VQDKCNNDCLGGVIKSARLEKQLTQAMLAERMEITLRYLKSIEKGQQKPSYDLLFRLIRELKIPADSIFYPELGYDRTEIEKLLLLLGLCNETEVSTIAATLQSLLESKKSNGR